MSDKSINPPGTGQRSPAAPTSSPAGTGDDRHVTGGRFLLSMASLAFVFVILAGIGSAFTAVSSSLPWVQAVVRTVGYLLQAFAVVWFVVLAVSEWRLFVKADNTTIDAT